VKRGYFPANFIATLGSGQAKVPLPQVLKALNGAPVALCTASVVNSASQLQSGLRVLDDWPVHHACVGLGKRRISQSPVCIWLMCSRDAGVIRTIDPVRQLLYVLTPVSHGCLRQVTTLVKGMLSLPGFITTTVWTHAQGRAVSCE